MMKTDVRETDDAYELDIDLPGFKKDEDYRRAERRLSDRHSAAKGLDKDEKDKDGKYIRQERYSGTCARTFYVGDGVTQEDIHAKYEGRHFEAVCS